MIDRNKPKPSNSRGPNPRLAGLVAFREFGPKAKNAVPSLLALLKSDKEDMEMKREVLETIGTIGPGAADAVPDLVALAKSNDSGLRSRAIVTLGRLGPAAKSALPLLKSIVKETGHIQAAEAIKLIEQSK
jgi:HEAT repeat protein